MEIMLNHYGFYNFHLEGYKGTRLVCTYAICSHPCNTIELFDLKPFQYNNCLENIYLISINCIATLKKLNFRKLNIHINVSVSH
jgi:hypothetical protein